MPTVKKIAIIEDDPSLLTVLVDKFELEGFSVFTAKNGAEGLEVIQMNNPDLVLLDIIMPKMDGLTMLGKLREDESRKNIPVIMLTNLSSANDVSEATKKGVHDYLVKSDWTLEEIVEKIRKELK